MLLFRFLFLLRWFEKWKNMKNEVNVFFFALSPPKPNDLMHFRLHESELWKGEKESLHNGL